MQYSALAKTSAIDTDSNSSVLLPCEDHWRGPLPFCQFDDVRCYHELSLSPVLFPLFRKISAFRMCYCTYREPGSSSVGFFPLFLFPICPSPYVFKARHKLNDAFLILHVLVVFLLICTTIFHGIGFHVLFMRGVKEGAIHFM